MTENKKKLLLNKGCTFSYIFIWTGITNLFAFYLSKQ